MSGGAMVNNSCLITERNAAHVHDHSSEHCIQSATTIHPTPIYCSSPQESYSDLKQDSHSWSSQDSGIPTLEINPPEPVLPGDGGLVLDPDHEENSPATLPLNDDPADCLRKSSTFPRSGFDSSRHFSPGLRFAGAGAASLSVAGGVLNRSDDISVCSVSSMSTELSVSNEDILDFTVTSDSSAIVTLETDVSGASHFSDVTLSSPRDPRDLWSPTRLHSVAGGAQHQADGRQKKLGSFASLFNRYVQSKSSCFMRQRCEIQPHFGPWFETSK